MPVLLFVLVFRRTDAQRLNDPMVHNVLVPPPTISNGIISPSLNHWFLAWSVLANDRPGARHALPSYFLAINFRCQANKVAGVTIVATCSRIFRLSFFA